MPEKKEEKEETLECPVCEKQIPRSKFKEHLDEEAWNKGQEAAQKSADEHREEEPPTPKIGNTQLAKMISDSKDKNITIRVVYVDMKERPSRKGPFMRSVVESVDNCKFARIAYLFSEGLAVGKRIIKAVEENPKMLTRQFNMILINNRVGRSNEFVDVDKFHILKMPQVAFEEVENLFPKTTHTMVTEEE